DGGTLCFRVNDEYGRIYALDRLACAAWPWTGAITRLTAKFDRSVGDFVVAPDGRIFLTAEDAGYVKLYAVPLKGGEVTPVLESKGAFGGIAVPEKGSAVPVVANWGSATSPAEIVRVDPATRRQVNLTTFNVEAAAALDWAPVQEFWSTNAK